MRTTLSIALLAVSFAGIGCETQPTATQLSGGKPLPTDWFALPTTDKRLTELSPPIRAQLESVRAEMEVERENQLGLVNPEGQVIYTYSRALDARIAAANADCSSNYMASWTVVSKNLSPEMDGLLQTWDGYKLNDSNIKDLDRRGLRDDWARIWMMDTPSTLNAAPVGNLTGNP